MRTGELANRARVNIQTVRFYERRGLLRQPARTASGYRNYSQADVESILFIRWCQHLGFTLKEVEQLLELHVAVAKLSVRSSRRPPELHSIVHMAEQKLESIEEKIRLLRAMGKQLKATIEKLRTEPQPVCPASHQRPNSSNTKHPSLAGHRKSA